MANGKGTGFLDQLIRCWKIVLMVLGIVAVAAVALDDIKDIKINVAQHEERIATMEREIPAQISAIQTDVSWIRAILEREYQ